MLDTYLRLLIWVVLGLITIVECFVTNLQEKCFNDEMSLPVTCLQDSPTFGQVPYFLVGDETLALQSWLLRPCSVQGIP